MIRAFFLLAAVFFIRVYSCHAEGLESYLATLGSPSSIKVVEGPTAATTRVAFQSQEWRGLPWTHELLIKNPARLAQRNVVVVLLTGGDGGSDQQRSAEMLANALGVRAAVLTRVPNQPLYEGKNEDVLLSFSLDQYRRSGDASWPLLFPMVASVVKGIDTLEQVIGEKELKVVLIGASKRGWTTYLTAAVDPRIMAMVPAVFEMVSMQEQIALMHERYGRDSEKIRPYTALGLTANLREPRVAQLISWVDPISYFPRFTMPKLVLLGANDPYWVIDSVRKYWDALPEPKMLRILPNVGHGALGEQAAAEAVLSFIRTVIDGDKIPRVDWRYSSNANGLALVSGKGDAKLSRCSLWQATSNSPDFREAKFSELTCRVEPDGSRFKGQFPVEPHGYTAVFGDVEFALPQGKKAIFSTEPQMYQR